MPLEASRDVAARYQDRNTLFKRDFNVKFENSIFFQCPIPMAVQGSVW